MQLFTDKENAKNQIILDTCALIDGRIVDIVRAGFVFGELIVPQFVVAELQFLADRGDSFKRERARFGLDVVRELQELKNAEVILNRERFEGITEVDDKLVALAKLIGAMLYTTDYNLNKVAQIEGVRVLNVNELAHALRPHHLPGEKLEIKITSVGQDKTQGVGHLEDGTMVVVEKGARFTGKKVTVSLTRILQTQAGKMMFATLTSPNLAVQSQHHRDIKHQPQRSHKPAQPVQQKPRPKNRKPKSVEDALMRAVERQNY